MRGWSHNRLRLRLPAALLALGYSGIGLAATHAIDDTGSATLTPNVALHWRMLSPRTRASQLMDGISDVRVRLNLMPWIGHTGRIFLVLPAQPPASLTATWTTQGRLLPGMVVSGNRTLVYSGRISSALLEDVLHMVLTVSGGEMSRDYTLNFRFELDEN